MKIYNGHFCREPCTGQAGKTTLYYDNIQYYLIHIIAYYIDEYVERTIVTKISDVRRHNFYNHLNIQFSINIHEYQKICIYLVVHNIFNFNTQSLEIAYKNTLHIFLCNLYNDNNNTNISIFSRKSAILLHLKIY